MSPEECQLWDVRREAVAEEVLIIGPWGFDGVVYFRYHKPEGE